MVAEEKKTTRDIQWKISNGIMRLCLGSHHTPPPKRQLKRKVQGGGIGDLPVLSHMS